MFSRGTRSISVAFFGLYLSSLAVAQSLERRQDEQPEKCSYLSGQSLGNGGRKVAFVIDVSNSMEESDPENLRWTAALTLDKELITKEEAESGDKEADLVTVITYAAGADVIYPLGDPKGAEANLTGADLDLFTNGAAGIKEAIEELTKAGSGTTENRTVIIVLTDGQDNAGGRAAGTVKQIKAAQEKGIRVSYGFLNPGDGTTADPQIHAAVLQSGGEFVHIDRATEQEAFLSLLVIKGLTAIDKPVVDSDGNIPLLPGTTRTVDIPDEGPRSFSYPAADDETFNITITAVDDVKLTASLRAKGSDNELATAETNATGIAFFEYTSEKAESLQLQITGNFTGNGTIFTVGLRSTRKDCPALPQAEPDAPASSGTASSTTSAPSSTASVGAAAGTVIATGRYHCALLTAFLVLFGFVFV